MRDVVAENRHLGRAAVLFLSEVTPLEERSRVRSIALAEVPTIESWSVSYPGTFAVMTLPPAIGGTNNCSAVFSTVLESA